MRINKGDVCLLKGPVGDVCVRVLEEIEPWQGAARFLGEKIGLSDDKVVVRRAFFTDEILKVLSSQRDEFGLSDAQSLRAR